MDYIELTCTLAANDESGEISGIVVALLAELGFESFEESAGEVKAYIPEDSFDANTVAEFAGEYSSLIAAVGSKLVQQENWNQVWESNFPMTEIAGRVAVYAPFHTDVPGLKYRICIMPQMSFGTGHHETTSLMIELMLDLDLGGKRVLDMGCGTGILAIFASIKKAQPVTAIDIDEWAFRNAAENCERNHITDIEIAQGGKSLLVNRCFDIILANINRNILLEDISTYAGCLPTGGLLQLSGFYISDFADITAEAKRNGLEFVRRKEKKDWVAALYRKT